MGLLTRIAAPRGHEMASREKLPVTELTEFTESHGENQTHTKTKQRQNKHSDKRARKNKPAIRYAELVVVSV